LTRRIDLGAAALLRRVAALVQDVGRDLDERNALRRSRRLAKRLAKVDLDRRPVEHALGELRERAADFRPVCLLKGAHLVLRGRMLPRDANDRASGKAGAAAAGHGARDPTTRA